ncbi:MAG: hypothetical protein WCJ51_04805, partial [Candidatus Moraniibacteriota bacterium]
AIIGILAGVILVSTSGARRKAQISNFKSETAGAVAALVLQCQDATPVPPTTASAYTTWGAVADPDCGEAGAGTFTVTATSTVDTACIATITETGATYTAACNS